MNAPSEPLVIYTELTTTIGSPWTTGVQRVVREIVPRLIDDDRFDVRPVMWCEGCRDFRRLTASDHDLLRHPVPGPSRVRTDGTRQQRGIAFAKKYVSPVVPRIAKKALRRSRFALLQRRSHDEAKHSVEPVSVWPAGSIFFEIEAGWQCPVPRTALLRTLAQQRISVVAIVNDVMPITHPQFFERRLTKVFTTWFGAVATHATAILAISHFTKREIQRLGATKPVQVVTYGSDFPALIPQPVEGLGSRPYMLCVATLEPRKNHALLLDAFDQLRANGHDVSLVLVGRKGWRTDTLVARIRSHPGFGSYLHWFDTMSDGQLDDLYRGAVLVAFPSWCEGFGLPVIEALQRSTPVISSTGGALPEAGGAFATYVAPDDLPGWVDAIGTALDHPKSVPGGFEATSWKTTADSIADLLASLDRAI